MFSFKIPGDRDFLGFLLFAFMMANAELCRAQFPPPVSSTGPEAAESQKSSNRSRESGGNIKLGSAEFRFTAGVSQTYNDNIGLSQSQRRDDFITSPHFGVQANWPITELNNLNANFEMGYNKYWKNPELDTTSLLISPTSALEFNFYIKDIHFKAHEGLSIQQDPTALSQLSNLSTFRRLTNTAGLDADWDLNKIKFNGGYDHFTFNSMENRFKFLDQATDTAKAGVGFQIAPPYLVGVQGSYSRTEYDQKFQNNSSAYTTGVFGNAKFSDYLDGQISVGYQTSSFDRNGTVGDNSDFSSIVYSGTLSNQLNKWLSHSLTGSRFTTLGIGSNFTEILGVNYQVNAEIIKNVTSSLGFFFQDFKDSASTSAEKGTRYGIDLKLGYEFIKDTSCNFGYQRSAKDSNLSLSDYDQNRFSIDLAHRF